MSTESQTPNVYEDLKREKKKDKATVTYNSYCHRGWLVPVGVTLMGATCFVAGFLTGYFAVSSTGKTFCSDLVIGSITYYKGLHIRPTGKTHMQDKQITIGKL